MRDFFNLTAFAADLRGGVSNRWPYAKGRVARVGRRRAPGAALCTGALCVLLASCAGNRSLNPEVNLLLPIGAEAAPELRETPPAPAPEVLLQVPAVAPMAAAVSAQPGLLMFPVAVLAVPPTSSAGLLQGTFPAPRVAPLQPDDVSAIGYTDSSNIAGSLTRDLERELKLALADGDVEWSVRDANGRTIPFVRTRGLGDPYRLPANDGAPFTLVFRNLRNAPYEVVATVDGLDVLSGTGGSVHQRGYVLGPLETLEISGFRVGRAAPSTPFKFKLHAPLLAAELETGAARNVGVLGVALFKLALVPPNPFPADPLLVQTVVMPMRGGMP